MKGFARCWLSLAASRDRRDGRSSNTRSSSRRQTKIAKSYFLTLRAEKLEDRCLLTALPTTYFPPSDFLFRERGFLSHPAEGAPLEIALSFLNTHASQLGLGAADLRDPFVKGLYTDHDTGTTHIYLRQSVGGLEVTAADLNISVTASGQVISVGESFVAGLADRLAADVRSRVPEIDAVTAVRLAAEQLHLHLTAEPIVVDKQGGPAEAMTIYAPDVSLDPIPARLHYVPTEDGGAVLAWELIVRTPGGENWFDLSVPATYSGQSQFGNLVFVNDWVEHASYNALRLPNESPQDGGFSVHLSPADAFASPFGWHDTDGILGPEFTDTRGNNVDVHLDRDGNNIPDSSPRPDGSLALDFSRFTFDPTQPPSAVQNQHAAQVNLFYMINVLHDVHYKYGFTESAGNFQMNNYGRGGLGNDAVQADAQDNANFGSTNNANFATPPDGSAPRMQLFEFTSTNPRRDSALDNGIIIHEYSHGISNRLTGGPANANALSAIQSRGMGEGWSDWHALMFLQRPSDLAETAVGIGTYVLGQSASGPGIRRQPYSFDLTVNPITFDAFGVGPGKTTDVHDAGEIWASALWDLNWLLIRKYGYDADLYTGYTGSGPGGAGNKLALRLVMDAMKLQPANPSFTQGRDALLAADAALTGGASTCEIWTAFARRGLGESASTASASSTVVTTSYVVPAAACGLAVTTTVPAANSAVPSVPMDYLVNFSYPVLASSLEASDFKVDGVPASSLTVHSPTQVTFHFSNPPFANQGPHVMSMAAGSVLRASDNDPLAAFSAPFRFDATPLQVVATDPALARGVFLLPAPFTLDMTFNEPVDPATVQSGDLQLSGIASATAAGAIVLPGNTTVRFTIGGVLTEGTLLVDIAAGAISDVFGNPMNGFSAAYEVDIDSLPLAPLRAEPPLGSLVYSGAASAVIAPAGDTDAFTLAARQGQMITVLVKAANSVLRPVVELRDLANTLYASATASAAGETALLQTVALGAAGPYLIVIAGDAGTTGAYSVQVTLDAAVERESTVGTPNDTQAAAEDLQATTVSLGGSVSRLAVIGSGGIGPGPLIAAENFESGVLPASFRTFTSNSGGRIRVASPGGGGNGSSFALLMDSSGEGAFVLNEAVYTVDLTGVTQATLSFSHVSFSDEAHPLPATFVGRASGDGVAISDDGVRWYTILNAPSNFTWATTSIDLAAAAAAAGMTLGPSFRIKFQQYDNFSLPTDGRGYDDIRISVPDIGDWYRFTLNAGDTASVVAKELTPGVVTAQLRDSSGTVLASAVSGAANVDKSLRSFQAAVDGTYYLVVTAGAGVRYSAVVTKNADFELEPNDSFASAQFLARGVGAVGYLEADEDWYQLAASAGDQLRIETATFGGGPSGLGNALNPKVELYDPSGAFVSAGIVLADGRNEQIAYTAPSAGRYRLRIGAEGGTGGEYLLAVTGSTAGEGPPFIAVATDPADGAFLRSSPDALVVHFSDAYLATTVQASDLWIDGAPRATGVTLVDGDTIRFSLPSLSPGVHSFSIAAGAIQSAGGTPLEAASGSFVIDATAPRVVASSLPAGAVIAPGSLSWQVTFSEPMLAANLTSSDFSLRGNFRDVAYLPSSFSLNPSGMVLTVNYTGLPDDQYTLTLLAGSIGGTNFTDLAGNSLDGEFTGAFPSGDGVPGGDFVLNFSIDLPPEPAGTPTAKAPLGSRVYQTSLTRAIATSSDFDVFTLPLDSAQAVTLLASPVTASLRLSVELIDPAGRSLAAATADGGGNHVLLQAVPAAASGVYSIRVSGADGTAGLYSLQVTLNAALESESLPVGGRNDSPATAQDISASFVGEAANSPARRAAVLGLADGNGSYAAAAVTPAFLDISTTGTRSTLAVGDDRADTLNSSQLSGFAFPLYGTIYNSISFSTNGLITFGGADSSYSNGNLSTTPALAAIAPLWTDLYVEDLGTGTASRAVFWQLVGSGGTQQLVIQWNNVRQFGGSIYFTFQAILSANGAIQFNYAANVPSSIVTAATVGLKDAGSNSPQRLLISYNQPPGALVGPNLSVSIQSSPPTADYFAFTLAAGETATLALAALAGGDMQLELRDGDDTILAAAFGGDSGAGRVISDFVAPEDGTYYARVRGDSAFYNLVVAKNAALDTEANNTLSTAQQLGRNNAVFGAIGAAAEEDWYSINLSDAGRPLVLQTTTPADGPNLFVNTLNPQIELYDAAGALLAQGTPLPDGRNETLRYQPAAAGTYWLRVTGAASTTGEYLLTRLAGPVLSSLAVSSPIAEGTMATLSGTFTDPDPEARHTVVIQWGGGEGSTVLNLPAGATGFAANHRYADDNPSATSRDNYVVSVTISNDASQRSASTVTVTVDNVPPAITSISSAASIDEGGIFTLIGTFYDPGLLDSHAITIAWGAGEGTTTITTGGPNLDGAVLVDLGGGHWRFAASHRYLDDSPPGTSEDEFEVVVTVTDDDGGSGTSSTRVTVVNVAPTIVNLATNSVVEGEIATVIGMIADAGIRDRFTVQIDWDGDGVVDETRFNVPAGPFSFSHRYLDDDPTSTAADEVRLAIIVTDDDGGAASAELALTISNAPPMLTGVSVAPIEEGRTTTLTFTISDPGPLDTFTILIDWGTGVEEMRGVTAGSFTARRQFLDNNAVGGYPIGIMVIDDDGGIATAGVLLPVANVSPAIVALAAPQSIDEGRTLVLAGAFFDPGILDTHTIVINWGAGNASTTLSTADPSVPGATLVNLGGGNWSFTALHQYADDDPTGTLFDAVQIQVTVTDGDGGATAADVIVTVQNAAPTVVLDPLPAANEGEVIVVRGAVDDPGRLDTFTLFLDWGDPHSPANRETIDLSAPPAHVAWDAAARTFAISHIYPNDGIYQFVLTVADDDGGSAAISRSITVQNVAPVARNLTISIDEDATADLVLAADDVAADPLSFSVLSLPLHGTLSGEPPHLTYTPARDFFGVDSFTFLASDGQANSAPATVTITIRPVYDAPIPADDQLTVLEDTPLVIPALELLANDRNVESGELSLSVTGEPRYGLLTVAASGDLIYVPGPDFSGLDSFTYRASDGQEAGATATVFLTVKPVNDPPAFAMGNSVEVTDAAGAVVAGLWAHSLSAGASDEAGQTLTFIVSTDRRELFDALPAIDGRGVLTFAPKPNASGTARVTVLLRDDGGIEDGGVDVSPPHVFTIVITKPYPWHNTRLPLDVNDDGAITPLDALLIFNYLNAAGSGPVPGAAGGGLYLDTSKDQFVSSLDALLIINLLNGTPPPAGEAPSSDQDIPPADAFFAELGSQQTDSPFAGEGELAAVLSAWSADGSARLRRRR